VAQLQDSTAWLISPVDGPGTISPTVVPDRYLHTANPPFVTHH
jgi:hypothetical protein